MTAPVTPRPKGAARPEGSRPAQGQQASPACDLRERVLATLARRWGERPVAAAITGAGSLLEVLTTPDGATWSIIVTVPGGATCLVSSGTGWRGMAGPVNGPEV